jgi:hypothetical protein
VPAGPAAPPSGGAHLSAFHRGSGLGDRTPLPDFSSALPELVPVSRRYPQTSQPQFSDAPRRPVVTPVGRVPEAARERVASPPAGTATSPRSPACLPGQVRLMGEVGLYVTKSVTYVNMAVTDLRRHSGAERREEPGIHNPMRRDFGFRTCRCSGNPE